MLDVDRYVIFTAALCTSGYCFGDKIGLGVSAAILVVIQGVRTLIQIFG